jgi:hypothetical protein
MSKIAQYAVEMLDAELSIVPVLENKKPTMAWTELQKSPMSSDIAFNNFKDAWGIGLICGEVSGGVECIDFDSHNNDIKEIYKEFISHEGIKSIIGNNRVYTEQSQRGGFHIIYRYSCDTDKRDSNIKLASWENGESMIETRGEGGYVIVAPSPNYTARHGNLLDLPTLEEFERNAMLDFAMTFDKKQKQEVHHLPQQDGKAIFDNTDPVSWFNWNKVGYIKKILQDLGWINVGFNAREKVENWRRPGKTEGISATFGKKENTFYCFTSSFEPLMQNAYYTPFQLLVKLKFKGSYNAAVNWIMQKYFGEEVPYVRVGTDYYKTIRKADRYTLERIELKPWKKDEIKQDFGKDFLQRIPLFDDFTIIPDNFNYQQVIGNCYNLYKPFAHIPKEGQCKWSEILMNHIFGEQVELGYRYLQALYLHPERMLPILVLVSTERQTGKTTFINWLNMIFGDNMSNISPEDLTNSFNHVYATSNIIAVEETLIEKAITVEKIKALATGKFLTVNQKFVNQYKVPFYGKIILASNNEDKFAKIDEEEIRFFIRKINKPTHYNHNIEEDLMIEIPAFLYKLTQLPKIDWSKDRSGFTPQEIFNESLMKVKNESKTGLYKDLFELITDWFNNNFSDVLYAAPIDIKSEWFHNNSRIDIQYIKSVLKREFKVIPVEKVFRYEPFGKTSKTGRPYKFNRRDFIQEDGEDEGKLKVNDDGSVNEIPW